MKILFCLIMMSFSSMLLTAHDVPLAVFHVFEADATLQLEITFDLDDFMTSLKMDRDEVNLENMRVYLAEHMSIGVNDKLLSLSLLMVKVTAGHIKVKGNLGQIPPQINTIEVKNTCLNNVSRHSNVVQLDLNNISKDYRMHKERTYVSLTY